MITTRDTAAPALDRAGVSRGAGNLVRSGAFLSPGGRGADEAFATDLAMGLRKAPLPSAFTGHMPRDPVLKKTIAREFRTPGLSRTARRAGFALRASAERLGGQVLSSGPLPNGSVGEFSSPGLCRTARAGNFAPRASAECLGRGILRPGPTPSDYFETRSLWHSQQETLFGDFRPFSQKLTPEPVTTPVYGH